MAWTSPQYVCLVDDPRAEHPKGHTLTVDHMGNVVGGRPILYVNTPVEQIRQITASILASGRAVWFGADCSQPVRPRLRPVRRWPL